MLPMSLQDKNTTVKEGLAKHLQDHIQAFFPRCEISQRWAQTALGGNRLSMQFFIVDLTGLMPIQYLNFGREPIVHGDGTVTYPLTMLKYINIDGPQPVETILPKPLLLM